MRHRKVYFVCAAALVIVIVCKVRPPHHSADRLSEQIQALWTAQDNSEHCEIKESVSQLTESLIELS